MNHSCDDHLEKISENLDEDLPLPEATKEHLKTCAECRAFVDAWEDGSGFLAYQTGFPKLTETPVALAEIIVSQSFGNARSSRQRAIPWFAAVAAAFVLVAGLMLWKPGGKQPDTVSIPVSSDPMPHLPDATPDSSDRIYLSLKIPQFDSQAVEARLEAAVIAEADSLAETGHRISRLAANLRRRTAALSDYIPQN